MKKFLVAVLLVMLAAGTAFAIEDGKVILTYQIDNSSGTYLTTTVSTTLIKPGLCAIVGFDVLELNFSKHTECVAAVYDAATAACGECLGEAESISQGVVGRWFYPPRLLLNAVTVQQGPNTTVLVYYTRN